ncbi:UDP-N-acetylglucosamine 2-epimerase [Enterobacter sp. ECC-175]|uniref:UDP-N-acetylglucosamine 2-epimerase n=1 Tax=unclassified Enterobacter TaxID=2608935 RepID=UPI000D40C24A|nr:UDP-N-acetylglucosamine 2-epimerase [Enterobacter sp. RIT 418]RAU36890.1 UDP-N-acetylglucosamine 2-epimerase (hydrolyzing) [Enterobacter sp. RIT 418]
MKKIVFVTGSRAEYGIMKRLLLRLAEEKEIELTIIATGMHCDERYGFTYKNIENDGLVIDKLIDIEINNDTNAGILATMARCQTEFGEYFEDHKFDAVMILGDRYEIFSVAIAAAMHNLPIIHLHGGEKTLGNYDEFIRHAITKMSRLHLASTAEYQKRIIQMGENPETVFDVGALGAENAMLMDIPTKQEIEKKYGALERPYFVVVFHPETMSHNDPIQQTASLLLALRQFIQKYDFVFIGSNSDTGSDEITIKIKQFCKEYGSKFFTSLLPEEYLALNKYSQGLIGNSSSGLIEIPSLAIPTINIGDRQKGRVRGPSVIDCICETESIFLAIEKSQTNFFDKKNQQTLNPYFKRKVLDNIVGIIKSFLEKNSTGYKDFYDLNIKA